MDTRFRCKYRIQCELLMLKKSDWDFFLYTAMLTRCTWSSHTYRMLYFKIKTLQCKAR